MARPRTAEAHERAQARKRQRKLERMTIDTEGWVPCGWCGKSWKPTAKRGWLEVVICPTCERYPTEILHKLIDFNIVKLKKKSKLPPKRKRRHDWGHLGTFDPSRPWMKWTPCEFCSIPICVNNNAEHKVKIPKYKGHVVCGKCMNLMRIFTRRLVEMKYLKLRS